MNWTDENGGGRPAPRAGGPEGRPRTGRRTGRAGRLAAALAVAGAVTAVLPVLGAQPAAADCGSVYNPCGGDPSGTVVTTSGAPVAGATVVLYRSDSPSGPFRAVPTGSPVLTGAERRDPVLTGADGAFGWEVTAGYYQVRAARAGCVSASDPSSPYARSATLTVPPSATGIRLVLRCAGRS
jgi:hypothetical protein